MIPPALFLFLRITLAIWGHLWFTINVRIFFSIYVENTIDILMETALNL